jgi:hypothetical protein
MQASACAILGPAAGAAAGGEANATASKAGQHNLQLWVGLVQIPCLRCLDLLGWGGLEWGEFETGGLRHRRVGEEVYAQGPVGCCGTPSHPLCGV